MNYLSSFSKIFLIFLLSPIFLIGNNTNQVIQLEHENFKVSYSTLGVQIVPTDKLVEWNWKLEKISGISHSALNEEVPTNVGNDVFYQRGNITEQYLFRGISVEQQFIVYSKTGLTSDLVIEGAISSNGQMAPCEGGYSWSNQGSSIFLGDVFVFDANGIQLPAKMEVTQNYSKISVPFESLQTATYPVTIDPQIGPDDFILSSAGLKLYQPRFVYNTSTLKFIGTWTQYDNYSGNRKIQVESGSFTKDNFTGTKFNISTGGPSTVTPNSKASNPDIAFSGDNHLVVWEDIIDGSNMGSASRRIMYQLASGSSTLLDTTPLFKAPRSATLPAVAGNSEYLVTCVNGANVLGKKINADGTRKSADSLVIFTPSSGVITCNEVEAMSSDFIAVAATAAPNTIYVRKVGNNESLGTETNISPAGTVGSMALSAGSGSSLLVWSENTAGTYTIKGQLLNSNGGLAGGTFQIDYSTAGTSSGYPSVAYNTETSSWLVAWQHTPSSGIGSIILGREVVSAVSMGTIFPVSKQTRTSVFPSVAYDNQNQEFWITWSGGGTKDQILGQRWIRSLANCVISLYKDTLIENNFNRSLVKTNDIKIDSLYATIGGESVYPLDFIMNRVDTFQTSFSGTSVESAPLITSVDHFYQRQNKLFYTRDDSVNYENQNLYNTLIYARTGTTGLDAQTGNQKITVRVIDVNEQLSASFRDTTIYEDIPLKIPFTFQSGDSGKERNSIRVAYRSIPATFDGIPTMKTAYSVSGGGHSDAVPRSSVTARDTLFVALKANLYGTDSLRMTLIDTTGGEWESKQTNNVLNYGIKVNVLPVNDPPVASNSSKNTNEDTPLSFSSTDFNFSDPIETTDILDSIEITSLPAKGTFTLSTAPVTIGMQIAVSAIPNLLYTPVLNEFGSSYASFKFKVRDNNSSNASNGKQWSISEYTFTINVDAVNDAPTAANGEKSMNEDDNLGFVAGDFNFSDPIETTDIIDSIEITTLPAKGTLTLSSVAVTAGKHVAASDLSNLIYAPALNENGTNYTSFTFKVCDNNLSLGTNGKQWSTSSYSFTINVTSVNDAPVFTLGTNPSALENASTQTVTGWASGIASGPTNESTQTYAFHIVNHSPRLFSVQPTLDEVSGDLTFTPAPDTSGVANIDVILKDNGGTSNAGIDTLLKSATITVIEVNDKPSFTKGNDQTALMGSGEQIIPNWATNLNKGSVNESSQVLGFVLSNDNPSLFTVAPIVDATTGSLSFTPSSTIDGTANIRIRLGDNGGTSNGGIDSSDVESFSITIIQKNSAPSYTGDGNVTINEDEGVQSINWATDISKGASYESGQTLTFILQNDNSSLFSQQPDIDETTGVLSFKSEDNKYGVATIRVQLRDDGGIANGGVDSTAFSSFTITVNSSNDAPSFTAGTAPTVLEDEGSQNFPGWATNITAGPSDESTQTLAFTITNDNTGLFSSQPAINAAGDLSFTPAANANGSATVRIKLADNGGTANSGVDTVIVNFTITVTDVNDAPSFAAGTAQTVIEDCGAQTVLNWATSISCGPTNENTQVLAFKVTNNNTTLFSTQPSIDPTTGNLTFTPAANANGSATVRVRLGDNGGTANGGVDSSAVETFTITVTDVNDAPSFTQGTNPTVLEDCGAQTITAWAENISAGPSDESTQTLAVSITNDNTGLFSSQPAINAAGDLTFTPTANANGSATVRIKLADNGGTTNSGVDTVIVNFTITVTDVNDAPSFAAGTAQTVAEDCGTQTIPAWATSINKGEANENTQVLAFRVTNNNTTLFSAQPSIDPTTGNLTFTPAANANGSATVRVRLGDNGGTANGGVDSSAVETFTITVTDLNDAPSFTQGTNPTVLEDCGAQTITAWAENISAGPTDESSQTLAFTITNDNTALFSSQPSINAAGDLTFAPAANANGSATVRIKLADNGGTTNSGVDTVIVNFTITVTDVNDAPSFAAGTAQTVAEDCGAQTVLNWATSISCGPTNENTQVLAFWVTNNNTTLFSAQPSIDPSTGNLTFTPATNANGLATVRVRLGDNGGTANGGIDSSAVETFVINITAVNDAPSFTAGANPSVLEDCGAQTITAWAENISAGPSDESTQTLAFSITNDNTALFSSQPSINAAGDLSFTPVINANGSATVRIKLADNGGTANSGVDTVIVNFTITVTDVNDAPSFAAGTAQTVIEDCGAQTIPAWATSINKGEANENTQVLAFRVTNNNTTLFSTQPSIDPSTGNLTFTPAVNANGSATVRVRLGDNGGTANAGADSSSIVTFVINVDPVNDIPVATNSEISLFENEFFYFEPIDFGFSETNDPTDNLDSISILAAPSFGHLIFNGDTVSVYPIKLNSSQLSDLAFKPLKDKYGNPYTSLSFKVGDNNSSSASNGKQWSSSSAVLAIQVINTNQPPTDILISRASIDENSFGAKAGKLTCIDPDPADILAYTITQNYGNMFEIVNDTLKLKNTYTVNYEATNQFPLQLKVVDGDGEFFIKNIIITVNNLNDTPSSHDIRFDTKENAPTFLNVAMFYFEDEDTGDRLNAIQINRNENMRGKFFLCPSGIPRPSVDTEITSFPTTVNASQIGNVYYFAPEGTCNLEQDLFLFKVADNQLKYTDIWYKSTGNIYCLNHAPFASNQSIRILPNEVYSFSGQTFGFNDPADHTDKFGGIKIITLPTKGKLMLNGSPLVLNQEINYNQISGLKYEPSPWEYGERYADFIFQVKDLRSNDPMFEPLFSTNYTCTINVTRLNFPPIARNKTISVSEEAIYTFVASDFSFTDMVDLTDQLDAVQIFFDSNPLVLLFDGKTIISGTVIPVSSISKLTFNYSPEKLTSPVYNFRFKVLDNNSILAPNGKQFSASEYEFTINLTPVNHPPFSKNITIEIKEDKSIDLNRDLFSFFDSKEPEDEMFGLVLEKSVTGGKLLYNGLPINAKTTVRVEEIGKISFIPNSNLFGENKALVKFRVIDNNSVGSQDGRAISDIYNLNISILPQNDQPTSSDKTISIVEGGKYHFDGTSFIFNDPIEPTDRLSSVLITELPSSGELWLEDDLVNAAIEIPVDDLVKLAYIAPENRPSSKPVIRFKVKDNNSDNANNGKLFSNDSYELTFEITDANRPPVALNTTIQINEDGALLFKKEDIAFNDPESDQADSIQITSLPAKGTFKWNNYPVSTGLTFSSTDISKLTYVPGENEFGTSYAQIGFKVKDNNSIKANNGAQWCLNNGIITIDILPVNDAPQAIGIPSVINIDEFEMFNYTISESDFFDIENDQLTFDLKILSGDWLSLDGTVAASGLALPTSDNAIIKVKATDSNGASVEMQITIQIDRKLRPLIYGQLTSDNQLPLSIPVALFKATTGHYDTISVNYSSNNFYYFEDVVAGDYLIKAVNIYPEVFPNVLSTYYQSTLDWELADDVNVTIANDYVANIKMKSSIVTSGTGEISGNVFATKSNYNPGTITTGNGEKPIPYVQIFLRIKGTDEIFMTAQTDSTGSYKLKEIPDGEYIITASIPGFNMVGRYDLIIKDGTRNYQNKNFVVNWNFQIVTGKQKLDIFNVDIYPNPTSGILKIKTDNQFDEIALTVVSIDGKTIMSRIFDKQDDLKIDISYLPKAEYLIELRKDNKLKIIKSIVLK